MREAGAGTAPRLPVSGLSWDSRGVVPGDLFFALTGKKHDGHDFIPEAIAKGAVAVIGERELTGLPVPYIRVPDAREALGKVSAAFYGYPTRELVTIGVTGTDGKTSVVHLLGQLLPRCETLTTVRVEREGLSCITTPEAPEIQRLAAEALRYGKKFFALEASSIGLAQKRTVGTAFRVGVFTNLSRDHLDFHGTTRAYLEAKLLLFRGLPRDGWAVVNIGSPHAERFLEATEARVLTYGVTEGDVRAEGITEFRWATGFTLVTPAGRVRTRVPFPGRYNLENALAAAAVATALGLPLWEIAHGLARAVLPPGRLVPLLMRNGSLAVVDYAHTPRALECVLSTLRPRARKLIVVFGAPGESDPGKRPLMGKAVAAHADRAIVTSDNPKGEDPAAIAGDVAWGLEEARAAYEVELDRAKAIRRALEMVGPGDIVLIAGKGHERYQLVQGKKVPYSDVEVLLSLGAVEQM
ncbi:UDP-N-acetylmuramoyl-L-alanyl-D-glutamate--2,6-diaminopimelate ligase [Candidatus Bipolaricaulota sp. J31]